MALTNHKQNNVYTKNSKETEERQPNKDVCIISNAQELKRAIEMLKSSVKDYNILGIHGEWERGKQRNLPIPFDIVSLATFDGFVAIFRLSNLKCVPKELGELLANKDIVKVHSKEFRFRLKDKSKVSFVRKLNLRELFTENDSTTVSNTFRNLCKIYLKKELPKNDPNFIKGWLKKNLDADHIQYAVDCTRSCIELFKFFAEQSMPDVRLNEQTVRQFLDNQCAEYIDKVHEPSSEVFKYCRSEKYLPLESDESQKLLQELMIRCNEYNVVGLACDWNCDKEETAMLQLASFEGVSMFVQLPNTDVEIVQNTLLKEIFEREDIVIVGIALHKDAQKISDRYGIQIKSLFDLRHLAKLCGHQPDSLTEMITRDKIAGLQIAEINSGVNHAQIAALIFATFVVKHEHSSLNKQSIQNIIKDHCAKHFNEEYKMVTVQIQIQPKDIRIVDDEIQCVKIVQEIKSHCKEYPVIGFDSERFAWKKSGGDSLLQLATHRGLCALIRLCHIKVIPKELKDLLKDKNIFKVGKEVHRDARSLGNEGIKVTNTLDVGQMAIKCGFRASGLGPMSHTFLNAPLYKNKKITLSNWERKELDDAQISYAAKDALYGLELFRFFAKKFELNLFFENEADYVYHIIEKYCKDCVQNRANDSVKK